MIYINDINDFSKAAEQVLNKTEVIKIRSNKFYHEHHTLLTGEISLRCKTPNAIGRIQKYMGFKEKEMILNNFFPI